MRTLVLIPALLAGLVACGRNDGPLIMAQVCLNLSSERSEAVGRVIDNLDGSYRLYNRSAETETEIRNLTELGRTLSEDDRVVNLALHGTSGQWISITNLGLPQDQLLVSFTADDRSEETQETGNKIVASLEKHWRVVRLGKGEGARPENCEIP